MKLARTAITLVAMLGSGVAFAHDGHGLGGAHWHATDAWGWAALAAAVAAALWAARRK